MPEAEKRKVIMRSIKIDDERGISWAHEATDEVPLDQLDAYVADAQTRWDSVEVQ